MSVGSGSLCITGGLRRDLPVAVSDTGGRVQVGPGLAAHPAGTYGSWQPGASWNFQLGYREEPMCDIVTQSHNLSNGYEVVFEP